MIEYAGASGAASGLGAGLDFDISTHGPYVAAAVVGLAVVLLFLFKR
jgi:hypothetical protein